LRSEYALPPAGRSLAAAAVWPDAGATLNCQIPFAVLFIVLVLSFTKAANALVSKISMSCNRHHPHDRHRDRHRYRAGKLFTETARPAQPELRVRQPHRCGCSARCWRPLSAAASSAQRASSMSSLGHSAGPAAVGMSLPPLYSDPCGHHPAQNRPSATKNTMQTQFRSPEFQNTPDGLQAEAILQMRICGFAPPTSDLPVARRRVGRSARPHLFDR
jgi:hypothetical protein